MQLALAPLQTYTDFHFRNAHQRVFSGIDKFYAPYLKMNNDGSIKTAPKIDILPQHNPYSTVIPQLMACCKEDFFIMSNYIQELGYTELNWNMGCPYPMVTNRKLGAGILNKPDDLFRLLDEIIPQLQIPLGIKMRMGLEDTSEILAILPKLNQYPLTEIIIHARNAKQLYTGTCDHEQFEQCIPLSQHRLTYNGDITTIEEFEFLQARFPSINNWMIGRGALTNPALFEEIRSGKSLSSSSYRIKLFQFSEHLSQSLTSYNSASGYPLAKLKSYWEYLSKSLDDGKQLYRKIKKTKDLSSLLIQLEDYLNS